MILRGGNTDDNKAYQYRYVAKGCARAKSVKQCATQASTEIFGLAHARREAHMGDGEAHGKNPGQVQQVLLILCM